MKIFFDEKSLLEQIYKVKRHKHVKIKINYFTPIISTF